MNAHIALHWLGSRTMFGSFVVEPRNGDGYRCSGNVASFDDALKCAKEAGGAGRITRGGNVVGYWGDVPRDGAGEVAAE